MIYRDIRCAENPEDILPSLADLSRYPLVTADEYLSGKVRQKLRMAKAFLEVAPDHQKEAARRNVEALEAVQPQDLGAGEIGVRIGANWVPVEVYQQFMVELLTPITMCGTVSESCALKPPANGVSGRKTLTAAM